MGDWERRIGKPVDHLAGQLKALRSMTTSPALVATFRVNWASGSAPLGQIARLTHQGDRVIVTPFDRTLVPAIVKSLVEAKQNAYALDPTRIGVSVPAMSVEQRDEIVRHIKALGEEARIAIRQTRQEIRKQLAASGKRSDKVVQELTDQGISQIDRLVQAKLQELS